MKVDKAKFFGQRNNEDEFEIDIKVTPSQSSKSITI